MRTSRSPSSTSVIESNSANRVAAMPSAIVAAALAIGVEFTSSRFGNSSSHFRTFGFDRRQDDFGGSVEAAGHVVIVRAMTDVSGEPPVSVSSARSSDVLVSVRSALAVMSLLALTILMLEIAVHSKRVIAWVLV